MECLPVTDLNPFQQTTNMQQPTFKISKQKYENYVFTNVDSVENIVVNGNFIMMSSFSIEKTAFRNKKSATCGKCSYL